MLNESTISQTQDMQTRLLKKDELDLYLAHLLRLDRKTREQRFDHAISDIALQTHCKEVTKYGSRVLGAFIDNKLHGVCEISNLYYRKRPLRELAFSVEANFQGYKIGSSLMKKALRLVNPATAVIYCQISNIGMLALAEKFNANITLKRDHVVSKLKYKSKTKKKILLKSTQFEMTSLRDLVSINPYF